MQTDHTSQSTSDTKRCPKCGETKPRLEFYKCRSNHDGLQDVCRACSRKRALAWYVAHREQSVKRMREWYADNRENIAESKRVYYAANRKARSDYAKSYRVADPEKRRAHTAVSTAIMRGRIPSASEQLCFICGVGRWEDPTVVMEYHHMDYSKSLELIPVCAPCHHRWHSASRTQAK